ncbi:hypothetical protein [Ruixingdingia sedimenti]|uniref:Uncharacterized protein n=1 Tax=Ruixingdingia sedimenti TaxID=3073604 RepID=A0ABU1F9E0_9RHOB|nr:hypothetical protein [Xinfangfangia sp. LG-4]MDR5653491.1 hypothetical protein [Xinfangfangia sp. LG-4]
MKTPKDHAARSLPSAGDAEPAAPGAGRAVAGIRLCGGCGVPPMRVA